MTMSQNQEIIEAKLCGYIDGELDATERAEIEKHLEANPQHRRLLESLKATRELIKWLPRESAPTDIAETLNGQLERSVLLDDAPDSLRQSIWPRAFAAAAIILLTAGLGLAVYFTLPKSQKNATPYAMQNPALPAASQSAPAETDHEMAVDRRDLVMKSAATPEVSEKSELSVQQPASDLDRLAGEVSRNRLAILAAANADPISQKLADRNAAEPNANALVMLVRSNSPKDTRRQLTDYLDSQKIQWKLAESQEALAQEPQIQLAMKQAAPQQLMARQSYQPPTTQDAAKASQASAENEKSQNQAVNQQTQFRVSADNSQMATANQDGNATNAQLAADLYVASMSRQQAVQLTNSISQEGAQSAQLKEVETLAIAPATGPSNSQSPVEHAPMASALGGIRATENPAPATNPTASAWNFKEAPPTTQPAEAGAAASGQPLQVVIVVQPATTQPTTAPATTEPGNLNIPQTQPAQPQ